MRFIVEVDTEHGFTPDEVADSLLDALCNSSHPLPGVISVDGCEPARGRSAAFCSACGAESVPGAAGPQVLIHQPGCPVR